MSRPSGECVGCGGEGTIPFGGGWLCEDCKPTGSASSSGKRGGCGRPDTRGQSDARDEAERDREETGWRAVDWTAVEPDCWPAQWVERDFWMGRVGKRPFAPWGDRDASAPCTDADHDAETCSGCDCDARWKWSYPPNWTDFETAGEWADKHPEVDGRVVLLEDEDDPYTDDPDPFAFVDGDDVRDPDTGEVHPAFVEVLEALGMTYADVSVSGAGVHATYVGQLPDGWTAASWELDDEPVGDNDDPPTVEIYDGKRVCVVTGDHVVGTPKEVRPWDADVLATLLEEHAADQRTGPDRPNPADRERGALDDYEPSVEGANETTGDIRDVYAAVDRLQPSDLPLRTRTVGTDATRWEQWDPSTYRTSASGDSLHRPPDELVFYDHKTGHAFGVLSLFAAERDIVRKPWHDLEGADWWEAVEAARDAGAPIPEFEGDDAAEPAAALPTAKLAALDSDERRRAARRRGLEWPTTDGVRRSIRERTMLAFRRQERTVLDAPTAAGKSHTVATEPWLSRTATTGDAPVIHLHPTRDARDQAFEASRGENRDAVRLLGRHEACPVAAGDFDPDGSADIVITIDGMPASEWLQAVCDGRGVPFSVAHAYLEEHNDQQRELPCRADGDPCPYEAQWEGVPRTEEGEPAHDVVHATHPMAHVPSLRRSTNVVLDEEPDYEVDLDHDRVRRAVTAYLREVDAVVETWEGLVGLAGFDDFSARSDAAAEREQLQADLEKTPRREWYLEHPDAHALAPALARAAFYAVGDRDDEYRRTSARVAYEPPRFDADGEDGGAREYVTVVLDGDNTVRRVWDVPDFGRARTVLGLDAHPSMPRWQLNVHPEMTRDELLDDEQRQLWRRFERGLTVVQVGDAVRPWSSGEYYDADGTEAFLGAVADAHDDDFRTAITASATEDRFSDAMTATGVDDPATMHFGEEKGLNRFAGERVGVVAGCIDPGDDYVLDTLEALGLDARPERADHDCRVCAGDGCSECDGTGKARAHGRAFVGPDADAAEAVLASVREHHVAQAVGRYARDADGEGEVLVYVRTSAVPPGFVDMEVPGVQWVGSETQREIATELRERSGATARELAEAVGCSKQHVADTLQRLLDDGAVRVREGVAAHGADRWRASGSAAAVAVDLGEVDITSPDVWDSYTWALAVSDRLAGSTETGLVELDGPWRTRDGQATLGELDPPD